MINGPWMGRVGNHGTPTGPDNKARVSEPASNRASTDRAARSHCVRVLSAPNYRLDSHFAYFSYNTMDLLGYWIGKSVKIWHMVA